MSTTGPSAMEFAYVQAVNSMAARIRAGRQMHRSQRARLYVELTTRATRFRDRPVEAITLSQPYLRTADTIRAESPRGIYAEVPCGMATLQNRRPRNRTAIAGRLVSGFDSLTLDPSPRLRLMRARLHRRNFYMEARKLLSQAMTESVQSARTRS